MVALARQLPDSASGNETRNATNQLLRAARDLLEQRSELALLTRALAALEEAAQRAAHEKQ
jgi:hypothetical protein